METLTDLPSTLVGATSVAGMLAALFYMLASGRLVTRREHEGRVVDLKEQNTTLRETITVKDVQLEKLAVVGETQVKILTSIEALAREKSR